MMMLNETELKASIVLQAMVSGLLKSKDDPNFIVEMKAYGYVKKNLCYGCCSTVTLAEMFGKGQLASELMFDIAKHQPSLSPGFCLSSVLQLEPSSGQDSLPIDLRSLERTVDSARKGGVSSLIAFFTGEINGSFDYRWLLEDDNWEEQLPIVEETIAEMREVGY